jgi:molybdopterin synthase catalytic subunit/molybdopterin converting factor small subunit
MEDVFMKLTIHMFAGLSEVFKADRIQIHTGEETITADLLKQIIIQNYPHAEHLIQQAFIAKNHAYAASDEVICEQDEIALIPPVSGGEETSVEHDLFQITYDPLDIEEVAKKVIHAHNGASISFIGTTREFTQSKKTIFLEYEAYIPMAQNAIVQIGQEITDQWPGTLTAISHRLGKVEISETSVIIAVSSPHRDDCYEASRYAIERLKQIVPIWKKEIWEDGSEWKGHQQGPWNPMTPLIKDK